MVTANATKSAKKFPQTNIDEKSGEDYSHVTSRMTVSNIDLVSPKGSRVMAESFAQESTNKKAQKELIEMKIENKLPL